MSKIFSTNDTEMGKKIASDEWHECYVIMCSVILSINFIICLEKNQNLSTISMQEKKLSVRIEMNAARIDCILNTWKKLCSLI